jgi:predicted ester cyclase
MMHAAMPEFAITVHEMLQDQDKVVVHAAFSGTHQGELMGVPPSGERVEMPVIDIMQVRGDKIVAHWGCRT